MFIIKHLPLYYAEYIKKLYPRSHTWLSNTNCNIRATCLSYSASLQQFLETKKDFTNTNLYVHIHMLKASSKELASGLIINRSLVIILLQLVDIVTKSDLACSDFTNVFNMYDTKGFFIGILLWHFYKCINRKQNNSSLHKGSTFFVSLFSVKSW